MSWLIPPSELTPEQQRAVQLSTSEHRAILGGPGSGKTQILLHRARYLRDSLNVSADRFKIFVFTNVLKDYIKTALCDLQLPEDSVLTFDLWCGNYYKEHIDTRLPWDSENKCIDFDSVRRAVLNRASAGPQLFDFVMIDEGQDLTEEVYALLSKISRHVTVCLDNKQQIYDNGSTEAGILKRLGIRKRNINLIEAFRVCPYLVDVAAQLIPDPQERSAFQNQTRQPQIERQTPLIYFSRNFEDDRQMLYQIVRERQLKNERIGILLPQNRQVFGYAKGLREVGIEVEIPPSKTEKSQHPAHDFSSSRPKLMSFHSAKGLTFDTVLMPNLSSRSFGRIRGERIERLLFVAITRATKWCYFSTSLESPFPLLQDKLVPLAASRQITLRDGSQVVPQTTFNSPDADADSSLDFL